MNDLLSGAIVMGSTMVGLFFLRYWRNTRDRFFLYFALSFFIEGLHRIYVAETLTSSENSPLHYLIRLLAYGLILWAIIEKNWPKKQK